MSDSAEVAPEPSAGSPRATSPLRQVGYAAVLVALAFSQAGGRMVADTKFDLVTRPLTFLARGLRLWDPVADFGQIQNQAYGYVWPMGPFFVAGHALHVPEWVVQRAWWSLLLCLAFFGMLRLAQRLAIGSPVTQVISAFAFVLTPRFTTLIGGASVELWPMALAPWVLLPLVTASQRGSVRRGAALSALAVASCGGVNAVAVAAVLPLGVIWIVTRQRGPRRWRLLAWWSALTVAATAWWWGPLLLMGRYSAPFLDYIENATITSVPTDLSRTLLGVSDWVAYFAGYDYPAGRDLVATPFLLLDAMALAALGLVGVCVAGSRHQRFLVLSVLTGVALVGFGYAGNLSGFFAADRRDLLDGVLAPLRNLHKFDVVLRLPLALGLANALTHVPALLRASGAVLATRVLRAAVALSLVGMLLPWANGLVAPPDGVDRVPSYWTQVASYLEENARSTTSLELPASPFGVYTWGNVHDDVMQGLADSPWAVRNIIPLTQPGAVSMMDRITRAIEGGYPGDRLADFLAQNGVGHLVVRNDLDRLHTGAPDPTYVRAVLARLPGIRLVRSFGPLEGERASRLAPDGKTRVVQGTGLSTQFRAVDVYEVRSSDQATLTTSPGTVLGDPGSGLDAGMASITPSPRVLAGDVRHGSAVGEHVLTDSLRRQEENFAAVRWNHSATLPPNSPYRLVGTEHARRLSADQSRWETTEIWVGGVSGVFASSSEAFADAVPPLTAGAHPGAAVDGDTHTAWSSARHLDPTGQWWEMDFDAPRTVRQLSVSLARGSAKVEKLQISLGGARQLVLAPAPGRTAVYQLDLPPGRLLRITAAGRDLALPGSFSISEVRADDVRPQRYLSMPVPPAGSQVDAVSMTRDPDRRVCVPLDAAVTCDESLRAPGEDGDVLARLFRLPQAGEYDLSATGSLRRRGVSTALQRAFGASVTMADAPALDPASRTIAMVDGDPATTWLSSKAFPRLELRLRQRTPLHTISMTLNEAAPASRPSQLLVRSGKRSAVVVLDDRGEGQLPAWNTKRLTVIVQQTERALTVEGTSFVDAPPGVSELLINGVSPVTDQGSNLRLPCGSGPELKVGDQVIQTSVNASLRTLLLGDSVTLQVCGTGRIDLGTAPVEVLAAPNRLFRTDSITLRRAEGPGSPRVTPLELGRTGNGDPVSVRLPARTTGTLLALPQNLNVGWQARLGGRELTPQRVDGWKQGWWVPAGAAATVRFEYHPARQFQVLLGGGAALVLLVLVVAIVRPRSRRRPDRPPLVAGRAGVLDLVVVGVAGGLLAGWVGLVGGLAAVGLGLLLPYRAAWSALAATALAAAGVGLTWSKIAEQHWALTWTQSCSMLALAAVIAAAATRRARYAAPASVVELDGSQHDVLDAEPGS
ncbi:MAG TPA: alpha-(1-_3)-arabinofuranosyltransferase family protein [Marmoricola sp.]|nr:alpha-(1->3)-arabinofuranosyltransferase family protein [Marmoricola sp.]